MHGVSHWERVERNGLLLATPECDVTVIRLFAYLHDSCRENDGDDNRHGPRAAQMMVGLRDTLLKDRPDFKAEDLKYIPFSGGDTIRMHEVIKEVSGVDVPLFEAQIPYVSLLKDMDHQLLVNLVYERTDTDRYPGLQVGSIENPNNNAGNWE